MPKRLSEIDSKKIEKYQRKIRKIQQSSSEDSSDDEEMVEVIIEEPASGEEPEPPEIGPEEPEIHEPDPETAAITQPGVAVKVPDLEPELDPDLLTALGDAGEDIPKFGEKIHPNLAQRWHPILRKGLIKETKEKLLKSYPIPENCTLLQAPKLNVEISAAVLEVIRNRDKKIEAAQQQLGTGIAAVNKGLTMLLTSEDKVTAIKHLSDACRILSDLHFMETQTRTKLVTPALSKQFLTVIQDCERDDTLFGAKLSDKIKASKAIEKQGLQIKKVKNTAAGTSTSTAPRAGYHHQGNWTAPSRYPSSRGGRGGPRRPAPAPSRRTAAPPQSRPAGQNKPRATQQ